GPGAGHGGGKILYSGPLPGLKSIEASETRRHLFHTENNRARLPRKSTGLLRLENVTRNNLNQLNVDLPLGVFTTVTGVSGSGKSSLISQALVEFVAEALGQHAPIQDDEGEELERTVVKTLDGRIVSGMENIKRLVVVDQKAIGRT